MELIFTLLEILIGATALFYAVGFVLAIVCGSALIAYAGVVSSFRWITKTRVLTSSASEKVSEPIKWVDRGPYDPKFSDYRRRINNSY